MSLPTDEKHSSFSHQLFLVIEMPVVRHLLIFLYLQLVLDRLSLVQLRTLLRYYWVPPMD